MAPVFNLNKYRKKKACEREQIQARENQIRHGRTKRDKQNAARELERIRAELEGSRLDEAPDPGEPDMK